MCLAMAGSNRKTIGDFGTCNRQGERRLNIMNEDRTLRGPPRQIGAGAQAAIAHQANIIANVAMAAKAIISWVMGSQLRRPNR